MNYPFLSNIGEETDCREPGTGRNAITGSITEKLRTEIAAADDRVHLRLVAL